eukprot:1334648-Pleurochrysis_carterae.AAC.3
MWTNFASSKHDAPLHLFAWHRYYSCGYNVLTSAAQEEAVQHVCCLRRRVSSSSCPQAAAAAVSDLDASTGAAVRAQRTASQIWR